MRQILFLLILSCSSFCLGKKIRVVTTFTIIADMAKNIAGDVAIVESITKPGAEIHEYDPTPKDLVKAQHADLILWNGMSLERWFLPFFQDIKNVPQFTLTDGIDPLSIYEGPYEGKANPHAWMSPKYGLKYIENIKKALISIDPLNTEAYEKNSKEYAQKVRAILIKIKEFSKSIPKSQRWLVSSEGAFSYLAKDLSMQEAYLWPINADQQGTPQQVKKVIDLIRAKKIPVIFSESTISDKPAKSVAKETGALYGGVLYVDSLSKADGPVPTYLSLLEVTTKTIVRGFIDAGR